jgi:hypothetical protein
VHKTYAEGLDYWCNKASRGAALSFAPRVGDLAAHLLRELDRRSDRTARAPDLPRLADKLGIPRKFLSRALAASYGLVSLHLGPPVRVVLHRKLLLRSKIAIPNGRGHISAPDRARLLREDGHKCGHCGTEFDAGDLVIDHLIPLAVRGADEPANWVALCREDNRKKWRHFGYGFIRHYRGGPVRNSVGVRFRGGFFWPHVNGRTRLDRRADWDEVRLR